MLILMRLFIVAHIVKKLSKFYMMGGWGLSPSFQLIFYHSCEIDFEVPIILGKPFPMIERALFDIETSQLKFQLNYEKVTFNTS